MRSTLHANCGCQWQSRKSNPADVLTDAVRHVAATGHTVDIGGIIRPSTLAYKAPLPARATLVDREAQRVVVGEALPEANAAPA